MDDDTRTKIRKNMTTERDFKNQLAYARKEGRQEGVEVGRLEGREEGREEERRLTAAKFKALGVDVILISQATGLSIDEIETL